jgi:hypothetical protein
MGRIVYPTGPWVLAFEARGISFAEAEITNYESIETDIDHHFTVVLTPRVYFNTGLLKSLSQSTHGSHEEPTENSGLRLQFSSDFYFLGATAVASKEFAFGIAPSPVVSKVGLGAALPLGNVELRAKASWVKGVKDSQEIVYSAPMLTSDYILEPVIVEIGLVFRL